ncbi:UDP-N-acetylglucosamine 2-epimerase [Paenibacillus alginolyticus]|uniref:UDP-N-acetylglucosamine 2-epimerase n=1 Tax=Paenibacillus alginolyticus TaxID=59839 RepID=A0ABT4G8N4_9BACL|nr:UDP-N-acetylglucosamine 2-epimerase [Paenibacillus alginolyticus]MEC0143758.1 UDP-N-acetylglucosamine 2-epimerase [Paenibacillus alginolyticus]
MVKRKICIVTSTRSDYGLNYWIMKRIKENANLELQIIASGMHMSTEFGLTYKEIERDGFTLNKKIEILLSSDTSVGITKSLGLALISFSEAFQDLKPDLIVLLGDRFEIMAAAQAAMIANIPIAHVAGGDTTIGAYDEAIRHSLTKMSHLHFVTNESAYKRVIQLGENPQRVYNVGSTGIDYIKNVSLLTKEQLGNQLDFKLRPKNIVVTFHPVTLEENSSEKQFKELLSALQKLGSNVGIIITKPNADNDGRIIIKLIDEFTKAHENVVSFTSLGQIRYLSTLAHVDCVVGNSSSGLYEAPSFKKPTVNIGDRQGGRLMATSIINCQPISDDIYQSIEKAFSLDCSESVNPYGDGNSSERIVRVIADIQDYKVLIKKSFYEVEFNV